MNVLITGGAGFIGTNLTRRLLHEGCAVTVYDNFHPQIHGASASLAPDVASHVRLVAGDVRDRDRFHRALEGSDVVVHLAAETGTGQSMYELLRYEEVNIRGTANLLDYAITRPGSIQKIVVASSRAIYGEGKYRCREHGIVYPVTRDVESMKRGQFEPTCPICHAPCTAEPTDETSLLQPTSFYGLSKQVQEQMVVLYARALGFAGVALRYQNVYGPGQSLNNPYTGILAIFSTLARRNQPIPIFEDGRESRDFVFVDDVVEATWRAMRMDVGTQSVNVGSGTPATVLDVATQLVHELDSASELRVTGEFRSGDIRHNFADTGLATRVLGFTSSTAIGDGLRRFLEWCLTQPVPAAQSDEAAAELQRAGLYHRAASPARSPR